MTRLQVDGFSISLDGYGAGPDQSRDNPIGTGGQGLHEWLMRTRSFKQTHGGRAEDGETGLDDEIAARGFKNVGATIMGRNMFGPIRGAWTGNWTGWWGEEPPFHTPVFVLTHHPREPLQMKGGTIFHFVTDGIAAARERAIAAAGGKNVRVGGGVATIRQFLQAGLIDEMHVAISPVLLGGGEPLFAGIDLLRLGYRCTNYTPSAAAAHYFFAKSPPSP
jgi:dihydrofolate reductase